MEVVADPKRICAQGVGYVHPLYSPGNNAKMAGFVRIYRFRDDVNCCLDTMCLCHNCNSWVGRSGIGWSITHFDQAFSPFPGEWGFTVALPKLEPVPSNRSAHTRT